ncbi:MAG TPA: MerR family transcriptional regulator, partial [Actinophytocola sp.]|nr:MerR family transcriptional regulator [Actinophytocola sp.]
MEQIARVLGDGAGDLASMRAVLVAQLRGLEAHAAEVARLSERLHGLLDRLDDGALPDPAEFMTTLELMSMFETYFTPEQRDRLAERRAELGSDGVDRARYEFRDLVEDGFRHLRAGTPTDDPEVTELVAKWDELGGRFH